MRLLILFVILTAPLCAQWIVNDPVNTAVNSAVQAGQVANHIAILKQWAEQIEKLNRQLRQLEEQLTVQQRIRDVMGDPSAAGAGMVLRGLGADNLARSYGETLSAVRRLSNAIDSLRRTSDGIYRQLDDRTVLGRDFVRQEPLYRRYAAVERQADNLAAVHAETGMRGAALQADLGATLEQLRSAGTQAEVDKLNAKIAALNGQLAHVDAQRRDEADKLRAQQILNENQAAKERQDFLEKQIAEEQQTLAVVGAWQQSVKVTPTTYTRP
ncbi:MAG: hypothetical protein EXS33_00260 [Pedosphaera sp.]|nr:hypothetical protein [Pedosphaera sp.]